MTAPLKSSFFLALFPLFFALAAAQDLPAKQSTGVSASYSPNSSHILIGISEQRRTWTAGIEYGRTVYGNRSLRLDYEASLTPLFLERDPTATGFTIRPPGGTPVYFPRPTTRVVLANGQASGDLSGYGLAPLPTFPADYGSQETYAASVSPLGARVNGFNSHRVQPTFSADLGLVFSRRNLPVDGSSSINFLFSLGPGIELFYKPNHAIRLEYLYRHLSNANIGSTNPGIDQGVLRVTWTQHRR